ncbi:tetratricopeptide repeat protein [Hymenobacter gummosus]|nr:tetratricopeptide repeat protein [Hymenobacter gummosus]
MRLILSLLAAALLAAPAARAQTEAAVLQQAEQLIKQKKYESAYRALDKFDPRNGRTAVLLKKEDIVLNYYLMSVNHQLFGLQDLKPNQDVKQLRGRPGTYGMVQLPLQELLDSLKRLRPTDYGLDLGLGHYYYALQQCGCGGQELGEEELLRRAEQYFTAAHAHQREDYESHFALGFIRLYRKEMALAVEALERSLQLNPNYPNAHYNLAYAYTALGRPADALPHARRAAALYQEPDYRADAVGMVASLEKQLKGGAAPGLLGTRSQEAATKEQAQADYQTLRAQVAAAVQAKAADAPALTKQLFGLDPASDTMYGDLMDLYQQHGQAAALVTFFEAQLPTAPPTPAVQGQLHFYLACLNMELQRPAAAYPHFRQADVLLRKVTPATNPAFDIIKRGLAASRPKK